MFACGTKILFLEVNRKNDSGPKVGQTGYFNGSYGVVTIEHLGIMVLRSNICIIKNNALERTEFLAIFPLVEALTNGSILGNIQEHIPEIKSNLGSNGNVGVMIACNEDLDLTKIDNLEFENWLSSIISNQEFHGFITQFKKKKTLAKLDPEHKITAEVLQGCLKLAQANELRSEVVNNLTLKGKERLVETIKIIMSIYTCYNQKHRFKEVVSMLATNDMPITALANYSLNYLYNSVLMKQLKYTSSPANRKQLELLEKIKLTINNKA